MDDRRPQRQRRDLIYDDQSLRGAFERVLLQAGRLAGLRSALSDSDRRAICHEELLQEAIASASIEGERLDRFNLKAALSGDQRPEGGSSTAGPERRLAASVLDSNDTAQPMNAERLLRWARLLSERPASTEQQALMVGPPLERLRWLAAWVDRTGPQGSDAGRYQTPGRMALAQMWTLALSPHRSESARLGRLLSSYVMAQNFSEGPVALSSAVIADLPGYYEALGSVRTWPAAGGKDFDATGAVAWFVETLDRAIGLSADRCRHLVVQKGFFGLFGARMNGRQLRGLRDLFEQGPDALAEGLSLRRYRRSTGASRQAAADDLADLISKGIVLPRAADGRAKRYLLDLPAAPGAGIQALADPRDRRIERQVGNRPHDEDMEVS